MSDGISGIKIIKPPFPVRPVQPSKKDGDPEKRRKDRPNTENPDDNSSTDKPTIDEYI